MDESYFSIEMSPGQFICISTLTSDVIDESGVDGLGDDFGYFVYEAIGRANSAGCIRILAKCPDFEAASRLIEIYGLSSRFTQQPTELASCTPRVSPLSVQPPPKAQRCRKPPKAELSALIADWRKRGEALETAGRYIERGDGDLGAVVSAIVAVTPQQQPPEA